MGASTVATALKKVTIIYPRFAIILIKILLSTNDSSATAQTTPKIWSFMLAMVSAELSLKKTVFPRKREIEYAYSMKLSCFYIYFKTRFGWVAHSRLLRILISYLTKHTQPFWIKIKQLDYFAIRWFSRYVIAAMLVDGKQKIAH